MAASNAFNDIVAARTRAAEHILAQPELLRLYEHSGGLADDLHHICAMGRRAEALNQAQSSARASTAAATQAVNQTLAALQQEHKEVIGIVRAVRHDLQNANADAEVLHALDRVMKNDAQVIVRMVTDSKGRTARRAAPARTQEAVRAEIQKDAAALLELSAAHPALEKRKVDCARLKALLDGAIALSGHLAERSSRKGTVLATTREEHAAVVAQKQRWEAVYRLLSSLSRKDDRVRQLLSDGRRRPAAKK